MQFSNLIEFPHYLSTLADWHYSQWQHLYPCESLQDFSDDLAKSLLGDTVPATWVLHNDEGVWASASVIEQDMDDNQELGPWLASVYVHDSLRGQGLGKHLIEQVMKVCKQNGLPHLYLFTPGQAYFYQTLGWYVVKEQRYHGENVSIMKVNL